MVEGPSDKPKRERMRLDLMAGLEFSKLHAHFHKSTPKKADERVARAIERALSERWSFRRVQAFCRAATSARDGEPTASPTPEAPLFTDGVELRIRRDRIASAAAEERTGLLAVLTAIVQELRS